MIAFAVLAGVLLLASVPSSGFAGVALGLAGIVCALAAVVRALKAVTR